MLVFLISAYLALTLTFWTFTPWESVIPLIFMFTLLLKFFMSSKNLLILLLNLEMASLILFLSLTTHILAQVSSPSLVFLFLVLIVSEASLGLTLLVRLGRLSGNEMLLS